MAVIGGGIQGTCVAMEFASRQIDVDLIEAKPSLMDEASRHNEGKIHLGFVYANDPTLRTAELMFKGASQFPPLMRRWLGEALDAVPISSAFDYVVHRHSLPSAEQLEGVYVEMARRMRRTASDGTYFGVEDPHTIVTRVGPDHRYGPAASGVFTSREIGVHPGALADLITKTVADLEGIQILTGTTVTAVDPGMRLIDAELPDRSAVSLGPYDHIVNCSWRGRPAIDATAGLFQEAPWTFRMKYFLLGEVSPHTPSLPSATIVLGGFGDVVDYGNGDCYLSWYPSGRRGWSTELSPPRWPTRPEPAQAATIARETLGYLAEVVPGVESFTTHSRAAPDVRGGVIFSLGDTDVHDLESGFHRRSEVGLRSRGRYHSVDTGKYTTAPLFAMETVDRIAGTR